MCHVDIRHMNTIARQIARIKEKRTYLKVLQLGDALIMKVEHVIKLRLVIVSAARQMSAVHISA